MEVQWDNQTAEKLHCSCHFCVRELGDGWTRN